MTSLSTAELRLQSWLHPLAWDSVLALRSSCGVERARSSCSSSTHMLFVLLRFLRTGTPTRGDWTKADLLVAAPTMGLTPKKLKQALGLAKERKQIEHKPDGTVLLL
jgi:hypothetical protein